MQRVRIALPRLPPLAFLDEEGAATGVLVDLVREALRRNALNATFDILPWQRAVSLTERGSYSGTVISPDIGWYHTSFAISEKVLDRKVGWVMRPDTERPKKMDYATGARYRVVVISGDGLGLQLSGRGQPFSSTNSVVNALRLVEHGRMDAFLCYEDAFLFEYHSSRSYGDLVFYPFDSRPLNFAVSRSTPKTILRIEDFNASLRAMHRDGAFNRILRNNGIIVEGSLGVFLVGR